MAIFTTRIINNKSYLAVKGDSRFARLANLTGGELMQKLKDARSSLVKRFVFYPVLWWCAPGNMMFSKQVDFSVTGSGASVNETAIRMMKEEKGLTNEKEISDFGRFVELVHLYKNTSGANREINAIGRLSFSIGLGAFAFTAYALQKSYRTSAYNWLTIIPAGALAVFAFSVASIIRSAEHDGLREVQSRYEKMCQQMKIRYENRGIPDVFLHIDRDGYHELMGLVNYGKKS